MSSMFFGRVFVEALQQIDVTLRERRVHAYRHQCEPRIGQAIQRCIRVVGQRAFKPRRIHERQSPDPPQFRQFHELSTSFGFPGSPFGTYGGHLIDGDF